MLINCVQLYLDIPCAVHDVGESEREQDRNCQKFEDIIMESLCPSTDCCILLYFGQHCWPLLGSLVTVSAAKVSHVPSSIPKPCYPSHDEHCQWKPLATMQMMNITGFSTAQSFIS